MAKNTWREEANLIEKHWKWPKKAVQLKCDPYILNENDVPYTSLSTQLFARMILLVFINFSSDLYFFRILEFKSFEDLFNFILFINKNSVIIPKAAVL